MSFASTGFQIIRQVLTEREIRRLRAEAERVAELAGSACVRHLGQHSQLFDALPDSDAITALLPPGMQRVRSILFDKTANENWPVPWHQDLTIAVAARREIEGYGPWSIKDGIPHVQPPVSLLRGMVTLRLHLDETSSENGALKVIPGSHRRGRIDAAAADIAKARVCECSAGDVLLMSPLLLHASSRSERPGHRRVLHFEFARVGDLHPDLSWQPT